MPVEKQVVVIYMINKKMLLDIPTDQVMEFEKGLLEFMDTRYPDVLSAIRDKKVLDEEIEAGITKAVAEYKQEFLN